MTLLIKRSLVEQAVDQLRTRITSGIWSIGQRLPTEPELAHELGISRNTVREAMRVLAFSGLVEIRQGDGSYLRTAQDPLQAVQAMARCTSEQAGKLAVFWKPKRSAWPPSAAPKRIYTACARLCRTLLRIFMAI